MEKRIPLVLEAAVLMAPAVLIVLWGIPHVFVELLRVYRLGVLESIPADGWTGLIGVIGGALALTELIRLASYTIGGRQYRLGLPFLLAVVFGLLAAYDLQRWFGLAFSVFVSAPLALLVAHMLYLQNTRSKAGAAEEVAEK